MEKIYQFEKHRPFNLSHIGVCMGLIFRYCIFRAGGCGDHHIQKFVYPEGFGEAGYDRWHAFIHEPLNPKGYPS